MSIVEQHLKSAIKASPASYYHLIVVDDNMYYRYRHSHGISHSHATAHH